MPDPSFEGQEGAKEQESLVQDRSPLNDHPSHKVHEFLGVD